jgi:hypothetical protein
VGDFNGDGKPDLVVPGDSGLTGVTVLLGNSDGTFSAGPTFPVAGQDEGSAVVADFNRDGKADLAITLTDVNQVLVLLGNGDGTFTPLQTIPVSGVGAIATGDFNGDHKADLVVLSSGTQSVNILLGNGDGTFVAQTPITVSGFPDSVAIGDFNNDGKTDLAVITNNGVSAATVLLGNGDGTFTVVSSIPTPGVVMISIAAGDFNGDGILDLAVSNEIGGAQRGALPPGSITILLGHGDGTFTPTAASLVTGANPMSVTVTDFNGDGKLDLAVTDSVDNAVSVFLGNGDGSFAQALNLPTGAGPIFVTAADFNGDGIPDLVTANNDGPVFTGNNDGTVSVLLGHR